MADKGKTSGWWQRPQLRTDEEDGRERRVTWLELFYDLIFVVIVSELTNYLAVHVDGRGVFAFIILFVPAWWLWVNTTYYNDRFETDDVSHRLATFLQMIPLAAFAVCAHDGLGKLSVYVALAYVAGRVLTAFLWLRGGFYNHDFRPVAFRFAVGHSVSAMLWTSSIFVSVPNRFALWIIGLTIDLLTPFWTTKHQAELPSLSSSHLPERFGLFTIIVLGEAVAGVVRGLAALPELDLRAILTGALGMSLAFALWWVYFDFVARRLAKPGIPWRSRQVYLHLPLLLGIAAVGAGIQAIVISEANGLTAAERLLVAVAVGLSLITIGLIETTLPREDKADEPFAHAPSAPLKIGIGASIALFGSWIEWLNTYALLGTLLFFVMIPIFYGVVRWGKSEKPLPTGKENDEGTANNLEGVRAAQE